MHILSAFRIHITTFVKKGAFVPQQIHLREIHSTSCQLRMTIEEKSGLPRKPDRPLTGYIRFIKERIASVRETNPQLNSKDVIPHIAKMWKSLSETQKQEYTQPYKDEKSNYVAQMIEYNRALTEDDKNAIRETKAKVVAKKEDLNKLKLCDELGMPKRPTNGYMKYFHEKLRSRDGVGTRADFWKYARQVSSDWRALSDDEQAKYKTSPAELEKHKKARAEWEIKMINSELGAIPRRPYRHRIQKN